MLGAARRFELTLGIEWAAGEHACCKLLQPTTVDPLVPYARPA
jgi:hypothetical protein